MNTHNIYKIAVYSQKNTQMFSPDHKCINYEIGSNFFQDKMIKLLFNLLSTFLAGHSMINENLKKMLFDLDKFTQYL